MTTDPTDLNAQQRDAEAQAAVDARARAMAVEDFKWLMAHKQGRRLMWRWLDRCGVYRTSMTGNSHTFFNEGRRDIGLQFLADVMDLTPEGFALMLKERGE